MYMHSVVSLRAQRTDVRKGTPGNRLYPSEHHDFRGFLNSSSFAEASEDSHRQ